MRRPLLTAALLAFAVLALPSSAGAAFTVGFSEQRASMFADPSWQVLGLKEARVVVGWDALSVPWQTAELDAWMAAARLAGARPLISLTRSRTANFRKIPTRTEYKKAFLGFRTRYPDVKDYITWNEANHCSQPICHKPKVLAKYYDVMVENCKGCRIVAADLLDLASIKNFIPPFRKAVKHKPKIWGIHNYIDANRRTTVGTKRMLELTKSGQLWFTETGGVVKRNRSSPIKFPQGLSHAADATDFLLRKLAKVSPRVKRVYLYHYTHHAENPWDSAVTDATGKPRPAYKVVHKWATKAGLARPLSALLP